MADLEEHAFRRDKRFIVRLVLGLSVAILAGLFLFAKMTSSDVGTCASRGFQQVTQDGR